MARVKPEVRSFFYGFSVGALFLFVALKLFSDQRATYSTPSIVPCQANDQLKVRVPDDTPSSPSPSPYLFMKKQQETIIAKALQNGEDLRMRAKLFKLYRPTFTCPYKVVRWGSEEKNGAKWVCGAKELFKGTNRTCVVYSFGVDGDSSFEADILQNTDCQIFAYDHTVDHISNPLQSDNSRVKFEKVGLADFSKRGNGNTTFKTVKQVMDMNGHKWIDILKLDVEGTEFDGMTMLMDDFPELPVGQLQVEVHLWVGHVQQLYSKIVPWLNRLEEKGLRIFWAVPNARDPAKSNIDCGNSSHLLKTHEYSFINVNAEAFRNSTFTFEKLLMGSAINTDLHYPVN